MAGLGARLAWLAGGLSLLLLCACAGTAEQAEAPLRAPVAHVIGAPPARPAPVITPAYVVVAEPEDFVCVSGAQVRVAPSVTPQALHVSVNGARAVLMQRVSGAELASYRAGPLELRRAGPRIALVSDASSVIVRSGDTLGRIALRFYGDRMRATDIARENAIANADLIFPGQVLRLPVVEHQCRRALTETALLTPIAARR